VERFLTEGIDINTKNSDGYDRVLIVLHFVCGVERCSHQTDTLHYIGLHEMATAKWWIS
jgi:hypothetical protein